MRQIIAAFSLGFILLLSGCETFKVKSVEGLQMAYSDVDMAASKGSQLRSMSNIPENQRQTAADLYRTAKATINAYFRLTITDASTYTVEKDAESYNKTNGHQQVIAFSQKVDELQLTSSSPSLKSEKFNPTVIDTVAPVAKIAIEIILSLNDKKQQAAYDRFTATINNYMMKDFEELPSNLK